MREVMTPARKAETTRLWAEGKCITEIAATLGVHLGSVRHYLKKSCGVTVLRRKTGGPPGIVRAKVLEALRRDSTASNVAVARKVGCARTYVGLIRSDFLASLRG